MKRLTGMTVIALGTLALAGCNQPPSGNTAQQDTTTTNTTEQSATRANATDQAAAPASATDSDALANNVADDAVTNHPVAERRAPMARSAPRPAHVSPSRMDTTGETRLHATRSTGASTGDTTGETR